MIIPTPVKTSLPSIPIVQNIPVAAVDTELRQSAPEQSSISPTQPDSKRGADSKSQPLQRKFAEKSPPPFKVKPEENISAGDFEKALQSIEEKRTQLMRQRTKREEEIKKLAEELKREDEEREKRFEERRRRREALEKAKEDSSKSV